MFKIILKNDHLWSVSILSIYFCLDTSYTVVLLTCSLPWILAGLGGSVGYASDWCCGFDPHQVSNILLWRFDHEIFSTVILSLLLIQEGQLPVSRGRMCTILINCL